MEGKGVQRSAFGVPASSWNSFPAVPDPSPSPQFELDLDLVLGFLL
jgi:hypothetical protein